MRFQTDWEGHDAQVDCNSDGPPLLLSLQKEERKLGFDFSFSCSLKHIYITH